MSQEIMKTICVLVLQNCINYKRMNPIEVSLDLNDIIKSLAKYKRFKYKFIVENLLFSSNLENNTDEIFITYNSLSDSRETLIYSKIYKTLGGIYLSVIKDCNLIKGESKRLQAVFVDSQY